MDIDINAALDDPDLFAGLFDGASWKPWKVLLRALFGLPMPPWERAIFCHHTGRTTPPTAPFREACLVVGRRGGKSRVLALIATFLACIPDHSAHTAPGETPVVAVIAADRKQARIILDYIAGLLHAVPALEAMIVDELAETVRLSNGVNIEIHTGSIGSPRGRTFIAVLCDEIAFWSARRR